MVGPGHEPAVVQSGAGWDQTVRERIERLRAFFPLPFRPVNRHQTQGGIDQSHDERRDALPPQGEHQAPFRGNNADEEAEVHIIGEVAAPSSSPQAWGRIEDDDDEGVIQNNERGTKQKDVVADDDADDDAEEDDSGFVVSEDGEPSEHSDSSQERTRVKSKEERMREAQKQLLAEISTRRRRPRTSRAPPSEAPPEEGEIPAFCGPASADLLSRGNSSRSSAPARQRPLGGLPNASSESQRSAASPPRNDRAATYRDERPPSSSGSRQFSAGARIMGAVQVEEPDQGSWAREDERDDEIGAFVVGEGDPSEHSDSSQERTRVNAKRKTQQKQNTRRRALDDLRSGPSRPAKRRIEALKEPAVDRTSDEPGKYRRKFTSVERRQEGSQAHTSNVNNWLADEIPQHSGHRQSRIDFNCGNSASSSAVTRPPQQRQWRQRKASRRQVNWQHQGPASGQVALMEAFVQPAGPDQPDAGRDEPQRVAEGEGRDSERNQETEADVDFEGDERDDDGQEGLDEGREWVAWDSGEEQADEERAENENTHLGQLVGEVKVAGLQALPAEACKAIARQFLESATSAQSNGELPFEPSAEQMRHLSSLVLRLARHLPSDAIGPLLLSIFVGNSPVVPFGRLDALNKAIVLHMSTRLLARCLKRGLDDAVLSCIDAVLSLLRSLIISLHAAKDNYIRSRGDDEASRWESWASMQEAAALVEQLLGHLTACARKVDADAAARMLAFLGPLFSQQQRLRRSIRKRILSALSSCIERSIGILACQGASELNKHLLGATCELSVMPFVEEQLRWDFPCKRGRPDPEPFLRWSSRNLRSPLLHLYPKALALLSLSGQASWTQVIKRIASPLSPSEVWSHGAKPLRSLCVRILTLYSACFVHNFGTWMPGVKPGPAATHLLCALCDFTESADELAAIVELCDALASSHEGFSELKEWTHRAKASSRRLRERLELQLAGARTMMKELLKVEGSEQPSFAGFQASKVAETALGNQRLGWGELERSGQGSLWRKHNDAILSHLATRFASKLHVARCGANRSSSVLVKLLRRLLSQEEKAAKGASTREGFGNFTAVFAACSCAGASPDAQLFSCLLKAMHLTVESYTQSSAALLQTAKGKVDAAAAGMAQATEESCGLQACAFVLATFVRRHLEQSHYLPAVYARNALGSLRLLRGLLTNGKFHRPECIRTCLPMAFCPLLDALSPADGEANATVQQAVFGVLSNAVRHTGLLAAHEPRQEAEEAVGFGGDSGIVTLSEEAFRKALTAFIEGTLWACVLSVQSAVGESCGVDARSRLSSARMRINVVLGPLPRFQVFESNYFPMQDGEPPSQAPRPSPVKQAAGAVQCAASIASKWGSFDGIAWAEIALATKHVLERDSSVASSAKSYFANLSEAVFPAGEALELAIPDPAPHEHGHAEVDRHVDQRHHQCAPQEAQLANEREQAAEPEFSALHRYEGQWVTVLGYVHGKDPRRGHETRQNPTTSRTFDLCKLQLKDEAGTEVRVQLSSGLARSAAEKLDGRWEKEPVVVSTQLGRVARAGSGSGVIVMANPPRSKLVIDPATPRAESLRNMARQRQMARSVAQQASQEKWVCEACTLENEMWRTVCRVCRNPRVLRGPAR